jgi:hypothetical protein
MIDLLLTERKDLVDEYFSKKKFGSHSITEIIRQLFTETSEFEYKNSNSLKSTLCNDDWPLITTCINNSRLFKNDPNQEQVQSLFAGILIKPLIANDLDSICYFFNKLYLAGFIQCWQTALYRAGVIISSKTGEPISRTNFGSVLNRIRNKSVPAKEEIDRMINKLKEKHN